MCGIAGIVSWSAEKKAEDQVSRMIAPIRHRGPDDYGIWKDSQIGIGLGHRRLSILDLSIHGHQPMCSSSERYVIVYNGEIYNFAQIRDELIQSKMAPEWQGHSDTEVLLAAIDAWGIEKAIKKARGMFAIALWDKKKKQLSLIRDRIGEKPLYYGMVQGCFVFASELKAITAIANNSLQIDRNALVEYMRFGYVPSPASIYKNIKKLSPGHILTISSLSDPSMPEAYWSLDTEEQVKYRSDLVNCNDNELITLVHDTLRDTIGLQMTSDVPLGAFLSGGIDSSTIVALMQAQSNPKIRTFTIGFNEKEFDEAPYAKAVAQHLGTEHTELYVTAQDAEAIVPEIPVIYDEPFADSSQIPTTLVSRLTKQHVTVSLSGDGGDELFAGYPRYQLTEALWNRVNGVPLSFRKLSSAMLCAFSAQGWDRVLGFLPQNQRQTINGRRIHRLAQLMTATDISEMYVRLMSQWQPEDGLVLGTDGQHYSKINWLQTKAPIEAMRRWDVQQYLCDDLLVKVDRASMSSSLESRAPLLDHKIVELAFALPGRMLIRGDKGKWVLRQVLDRYVPRELIERPKVGFSVPLGDWLRGPLRNWAESLLSPSLLEQQGMLNPEKVNFMWQEHLSGYYDRSSYLWNVLMFQAWYESNNILP
ncbi:MAG TPA: asparagine synthase (glutamine-hydrolyzing) [Aeromonadales bacterium]|nr:asparagine synthase (glutamine-hydrolyzing) [Aeromonadales bacterium]